MSDRFKKLEMIKANGRQTQETMEDVKLKLKQLEQEEAPLEERQKLQHRLDEMKKNSSDDHDGHHNHKESSHENHKNKGDDHKIENEASKFHDLSKSGHKHHHKKT